MRAVSRTTDGRQDRTEARRMRRSTAPSRGFSSVEGEEHGPALRSGRLEPATGGLGTVCAGAAAAGQPRLWCSRRPEPLRPGGGRWPFSSDAIRAGNRPAPLRRAQAMSCHPSGRAAPAGAITPASGPSVTVRSCLLYLRTASGTSTSRSAHGTTPAIEHGSVGRPAEHEGPGGVDAAVNGLVVGERLEPAGHGRDGHERRGREHEREPGSGTTSA